MNSASYSRYSRIVGTTAGYAAYIVARLIFFLPDSVIVWILSLLRAVLLQISGDTPAYRAIDDVHFVLKGGGEGARIFRSIITRSRASDLVGIVRGTVIRSL